MLSHAIATLFSTHHLHKRNAASVEWPLTVTVDTAANPEP